MRHMRYDKWLLIGRTGIFTLYLPDYIKIKYQNSETDAEG